MRKGWEVYGKEIVKYSKNCDFPDGDEVVIMEDTDSTEQCIEKVLQGSCVYIYVKEIFKIRIKNHWFMFKSIELKNSACRLVRW